MSNSEFDEILEQIDQLTDAQRSELLTRLKQSASGSKTNGQAKTSLLDAFESRGVVGSISDAPADLSCNPEHMKDFGQDDQ